MQGPDPLPQKPPVQHCACLLSPCDVTRSCQCCYLKDMRPCLHALGSIPRQNSWGRLQLISRSLRCQRDPRPSALPSPFPLSLFTPLLDVLLFLDVCFLPYLSVLSSPLLPSAASSVHLWAGLSSPPASLSTCGSCSSMGVRWGWGGPVSHGLPLFLRS